ncbi:MAG: GspH/FimT family pseudopilin [Acidobacteriota bacterium]
MSTRRQLGLTLLELLIGGTVTALLAGLGVPPLLEASANLRLRSAAEEIRGSLRLAQSMAIRYDANVGIKFKTSQPEGTVTFALYRDGDGDGVSSADIERGIDPEIRSEHQLTSLGRGFGFGFPPGEAPRDPGDPRARLSNLDDPVRFNGSDIASFSPLGTSTPGSVYLTDGRTRLMVVRLFNRTSKTTVLTYDPRTERWR